jgi:putative modified peptide
VTDLGVNEQQVAAQLIERLLTDQAFRARFRRDPAKACRDAGLASLADEMSLGAGNAMMTLEVRESKSSLAGVMMAAAMEGVGVYEFTKHVVPHLEDAAGAVGGVLSHVGLPAIQDVFGGGAGGGAGAAAVGPSGLPLGVEAPEAEIEAGAAPPPAPPPPVVSPEVEAAEGEKPEAPEPEKPETPEEPSEAELAAQEIAEQADPDNDLPSGTDLPDASSVADAELPSSTDVSPEEAAAGTAAAEPEAHEHEHAHESEHAHEHEHEQAPAGGGPPPDPDQYGVGGKGGEVSPEAHAVLTNDRITLDETGQKDFKDGRIDPRTAAVLLKLAQEHDITVTATSSDHPSASAGGGSNHYFGRAVDIGTVDGEIVRPGSPAAREIAAAIAAIEGDVRPTEVGTPFQIAAEGFFTDGNHQDHIHVAFDDPITADWKPPPDVAEMIAGAGGSAPAGQAGAVAGAAALPGAPAVPDGRASGQFLAVDPKATAAGAARATGSFLAVDKPATAAAVPEAPPEAEPSGGFGEPGEYPGDDAPKEQIALWMASRAEAAGLPPELPIMATLVESNMENLNHGDASSVGYFQMLTTIWDTGKYKGYLQDPEKQMQWFIDTASPLKARFGDLPATAENYGTWVADTERPAAEYRGRYAERFEEARELLERARESAGAQAPSGGGETHAPTAAADAPAGDARPPDPSEYGLDGTGGEPTPEALALLENKKITFDETGVADLKAGKIDPRVIAALTKLS